MIVGARRPPAPRPRRDPRAFLEPRGRGVVPRGIKDVRHLAPVMRERTAGDIVVRLAYLDRVWTCSAGRATGDRRGPLVAHGPAVVAIVAREQPPERAVRRGRASRATDLGDSEPGRAAAGAASSDERRRPGPRTRQPIRCLPGRMLVQNCSALLVGGG